MMSQQPVSTYPIGMHGSKPITNVQALRCAVSHSVSIERTMYDWKQHPTRVDCNAETVSPSNNGDSNIHTMGVHSLRDTPEPASYGKCYLSCNKMDF